MIDCIIFGLKVLATATVFLFLVLLIVWLFIAFVDWFFDF